MANQTAVADADVDASAAWERTTGDPKVVVAVLDQGYRFDHPDLASAAWRNSDEVPGNGIDDDGIPVGAPCGSDVGECSPGHLVCDPDEGMLVC